MPLITDNFCFLHAHKTGGTWVRKACKNAGVKLQDAKDERGFSTRHWPAHPSEPWMRGRTSFALIRDPLDYLRSWWCSREKEGWGAITGPAAPLNDCRADAFELFLNNVLDRCPGIASRVFREYTDGVDCVGRLENAADDLCTALRLAGERFDHDALYATPKANAARDEIMRRATCSKAVAARVYEAEQDYASLIGSHEAVLTA